MYSDVVSSVPVMFERPANRLSGYKYQEGGALSLETKFLIRSKASSLSSKLQLDRFVFLQAGAFSSINHYSAIKAFGNFH